MQDQSIYEKLREYAKSDAYPFHMPGHKRKVEAKKYTLSYDEYENNVNLLDKILKDKHLSEYKQITIGCWDYEGGDCSALLQGMIENKEKFAQIEGLFWGDIEQEEQEISWIEQADISPLLDAMPKLKDLKIKGTNNLRLGKTSRPELRSLEIISGGLPTEVVEDILGSDFPNLEKMEQHYQRAKRLMTAPSVIFTVGEPFLFGSISMWRLFYTKPGELERTAETLERVMKLYNSLTAGHGSGAAELYRGEVCCAQGRFADAEIYGYQALYASLQRKNACVTYGAALLLGTNAVYRGDLEAWKRTLDYLEDPALTYAFLQDTFLDVCMKETVQSYFAMLQPKESRLRKRLQAASNRLYDLNFTSSAIKGVRIPRIILKKNYHKAIRILEVALKVDARLIALPSRLFIHTNLALCYFAIGRSRKAAEHLEFTLSLAERDQVLSFAAYFREYLEPLFYLPSVSRKYAAVIQETRSLPIQNIPAVPEWKAFIPKQENEWEEPLSKREREIAELAARGLRNGEIAEMLHISEGTVKNHLKIVFRKLNIDRRSSLRGRLR